MSLVNGDLWDDEDKLNRRRVWAGDTDFFPAEWIDEAVGQ